MNKEAIAAYTNLLETWNRRDADGFAALFAEAGSCVGFDGSEMNGPAEIASTLRGIFADHPTAAYVGKVREVRRSGPEATLLRAAAGMIPPGMTELNPAANAVQSLVVVHEGEQLKIVHFQNTPAAYHGRPDLTEQLTEELNAVYRSGRTVDAGPNRI